MVEVPIVNPLYWLLTLAACEGRDAHHRRVADVLTPDLDAADAAGLACAAAPFEEA